MLLGIDVAPLNAHSSRGASAWKKRPTLAPTPALSPTGFSLLQNLARRQSAMSVNLEVKRPIANGVKVAMNTCLRISKARWKVCIVVVWPVYVVLVLMVNLSLGYDARRLLSAPALVWEGVSELGTKDGVRRVLCRRTI